MQNAAMNIEDKGGDQLVLHVGPQHPGSGHFRIIVTVDGDIISLNAINLNDIIYFLMWILVGVIYHP